jgi:glycosyltransferase involved in cell wall biosynthesis
MGPAAKVRIPPTFKKARQRIGGDIIPRVGAAAGGITQLKRREAEGHGLKIAYLVTRADPIGGVQIHIRDLTAALQAQGHSPTVITSGSGPFLDQLRAQNTPVIVLRHLTLPINPVRDLRALFEIRTVLKELRPDLVAAHSSKAGILSRVAGASLGIPVILTAHGWNFTPGIPPLQAALYRQIERSVGPLTDKIITVSEFDRQLALRAGIAPENRLVTVYNGIPDVAQDLRSNPGREPVRMVMVARFGPQKDHGTLLRALAGVKDKRWKLDLVGDGLLIGPMKALAESLRLSDRVHFLGQRTDVDQLLSQAQVSLLVTNWEGFPLSILEAMRAGLPVVASAVGGIGESVWDGETGYLVPRGEEDLLRDRIGRLLDDPALRVRLGRGGRARYEQHFTLAESVAKTLQVYRDLLAREARIHDLQQETTTGPSR